MDIEKTVAMVLFVLVHVLTVATIISMLVFMAHVVRSGDDAVERLLRIAAFAAGLLLYLGGRAYGISIPSLMESSLRMAGSLAITLFGILMPMLSGILTALFCIHMMKSDSDIAARGLVLFSSLMSTMFADTYAVLATQVSPDRLRLALPNITFVLGVILYSIFRYKRPSPMPRQVTG